MGGGIPVIPRLVSSRNQFEADPCRLEHLSLAGVEGLGDYDSIVGLGKHLCGGRLRSGAALPVSAPGTAVRALCWRCAATTAVPGSPTVAGGAQGLGVCPWSFCPDGTDGMGDLQLRDVRRKEETPFRAYKRKGFEASLNKEQHSEFILAYKSSHGEEVTGELSVMAKFDVDCDTDVQMICRYTRLRLSAQHRAEVGRKAKQVLDYGRLQYMEGQGFVCRLVQYVTMDTTPENVALIAQRVPR
ncbi:tRNA:m(4)X modification enzyme TRM13 [Chionoecetes opilio]|uniref:tRNA:m(4)X modification enzyme TRM13 n=1 Tax=Chionoecetes opilio TaxID=41210 RepID=A0A8J4YZ01_CHIOP|nr:tRNA:m(4)X modification enzyme TRM13 [Chionoecetes opilio]